MRQAPRARDREQGRGGLPTRQRKHYAHLARSYADRAHFATLGIAGDTTVTTMKGGSMALGGLEVWILA